MITGIGSRAQHDNITTMWLRIQLLMPDGRLGPPEQLRAGWEADAELHAQRHQRYSCHVGGGSPNYHGSYEVAAVTHLEEPLRLGTLPLVGTLVFGEGVAKRNRESTGLLPMAAGGSKATIVLAIGGNALITVGKMVAAVFSGSGAMWAETVHSAVDTLNQGLLLVGHERSLRAPTRRYPYGFAIEANFWGLLAAIGILFLGGGMTIYHGVHSLIDPHVPSHVGWVLGVLGFAAAVDGWVLAVVVMQLVRTKGERTWRAHLREQSASTITVLLEDAAAVLGCIIAALAVGLCASMQSGMPDAIAQFAIGTMLALVGIYLIYRNWTVLIGQALPKAEVDRLRIFLADLDGIERVVNVVTRRLARHAFTLTAEVEFSGGELAGRLVHEHGPRVLAASTDGAAAEVLGRFADQLFVQQARLVDRLEAEIVEAFPDAVYISLEPDLRLDEGAQ